MASVNGLTLQDLLGAGTGDSSNGWNWRENFVQLDENMGTAGLFIASESTLIGFGPAQASSAFNIIKVGLTPQISINQQIPQNRLSEIGSMRVHIINGTPVGGGGISRLVYNGPSLMRYAYGNLYDDNGNPTALALAGLATGTGAAQNFTVQSWANILNNPDKIMAADSNTNLWLSCWDTRLRMPFGLCMYFQDVAGNAVGGVYAEGTKIGTHSLSQSAGQLVMAESISFMFDRLIPVRGLGISQS